MLCYLCKHLTETLPEHGPQVEYLASPTLLGARRAMRIQVVSDLHLEFHNLLPPIVEGTDVLVCAGDRAPIGAGAVRYVAEAWAAARHILYVRGNHEFYGADIDRARKQLAEECATRAIIESSMHRFTMRSSVRGWSGVFGKNHSSVSSSASPAGERASSRIALCTRLYPSAASCRSASARETVGAPSTVVPWRRTYAHVMSSIASSSGVSRTVNEAVFGFALMVSSSPCCTVLDVCNIRNCGVCPHCT